MSKPDDARDPLEGKMIRDLAAILQETGLSEIEYAVGDRRIRVARNAAAVSFAPAAAGAAPAPSGAAAPAEPSLAAHPGAVKAPPPP